MGHDDEDVTNFTIVISVSACVWGLVFLPLGCYWFWRLRSQMDQIFEKKNKIKFFKIVQYCIVLIFIQLIGYIVLAMDHIILLRTDNQIDAIAAIGGVMTLIPQFIYYMLLIYRFLIIYYTTQLAKAISENEWKVILDPLLQSHSQRVTRNHWILSNPRRLFVLLMISGVCMALFTMAMFATFQDDIWVGLSVNSFFIFIIWCVLAVFYWRFDDFEDAHFIYKEMRWIFWLELVQVTLYLIDVTTTALLGHTITGLILFSIDMNGFAIGRLASAYVMSVLATRWRANSIRYTEEQSKQSKAPKIDAILQDEIGYSLMMDTLTRELAAEVLLSWSEFTQFRQRLITDYNPNVHRSSNSQRRNEIILPKSVPQSAIVYRSFKDKQWQRWIDPNSSVYSYLSGKSVTDDIELEAMDELSEWKLRAYLLYQRYIQSYEATFEINLSHSQRSQLMSQMNDLNVWMAMNINHDDLVSLFEDVRIEMYRLMKFSYTRLKISTDPKWLRLKEQLNAQ